MFVYFIVMTSNEPVSFDNFQINHIFLMSFSSYQEKNSPQEN